VVAPISNDKILPSETASSNVSEQKKPGNKTIDQSITATNQAASQEESNVETSSVSVDRASQIYNQSTTKLFSGEDPIADPEEAKSLAAEIRLQIETNGQQALKAQTGSATKSLFALLEAAPV
jgi:hypothetical protein